MQRTRKIRISCLAILSILLANSSAPGQDERSAAERVSQPGPEDRALMSRVGTWDVVSTFQLTPDAAPIVTRNIVAERQMIGLHLQEIMEPVAGSQNPDFRRISYLLFSKTEGRWQYVSLDTRFPVGIMPAYSRNRGGDRNLVLEFEPLAFVGLGKAVEGRMLRSNLVIERIDEDHETARQYFITADGTGREWLAVEYNYTRRR